MLAPSVLAGCSGRLCPWSNKTGNESPKVYSKSAIYQRGEQRVFTGPYLDQIAFPLGGIGAGQINLGGSGDLKDFSIFNRPAIGQQPNGAAAIYASFRGEQGVARVIQGPLTHSRIFNDGKWALGGARPGGYPHMRKATFQGEFPFATIDFEDPQLPVEVKLEAFSPFVPLDVKNSALPAAVLTYTFTNPSKKTVDAVFVYNTQSPFIGNWNGWIMPDGCRSDEMRDGNVTAVQFSNEIRPEGDPRRGTLAVALVDKDAVVQEIGAFGEGSYYWRELQKGKFIARKMPPRPTAGQKPTWSEGGAIGTSLTLQAGETRKVRLVVAWHVPNSDVSHDVPAEDIRKWESETGKKVGSSPAPNPIKWKPYYTSHFKDAFDVARYVGQNIDSLESRSRQFHDAFFGSTFPATVLDAASANLGILKSPTCYLLDSGQFWAYEGCNLTEGSCHGSCTHVWNYAQAMPHLFPQLERTLRSLELEQSMNEEGHVQFRSRLPVGPAAHTFHAAADGQMGGIMKVWRDWQISGDDAWLRRMYPLAKRSLDWGIQHWDPQRLGVLTEPQHNTYDCEFFGPNSMCSSFYLGALRAMAEMAKYLGNARDAQAYSALADKGLAYANTELFNGEYYYQRMLAKDRELTAKDEPWSQYGTGCLSDGAIGQWYTNLIGLPDALDRDKTHKHLESVFRYNFKTDLSGTVNPGRPTFAVNDESGLLICTWPKGGDMAMSFGYAPEVWTGIEYQVASHMILNGLVDEGLTIVKAVRDRYDGLKRNPWNEFECGSYYARAMASYAVFTAMSGFRYSAVTQEMRLDPRLKDKAMQSFFSTDKAWGTVSLKRGLRGTLVTINVTEGSLPLKALALPFLSDEKARVSAEGISSPAKVSKTDDGITAAFSEAVTVKPEHPVVIRIQN